MEKLKQLRIDCNYSCNDMAKRLSISTPFYWQLENEKRVLTYLMALKIASIFNLRPDDIFYKEK